MNRSLKHVLGLALVVASLGACGGRSEPIVAAGPASVLQVTVPEGVTSAVVSRVRAVGGVGSVTAVTLTKATVVGAAGRSTGLTLAAVAPADLAPVAPLLIGRAVPAGRSVLLRPEQRSALGVEAGDAVTVRIGRRSRTARVDALDAGAGLGDGLITTDPRSIGTTKPTVLLLGITDADSNAVAVQVARRLNQGVRLPAAGPSFLYGRGISRLFGSFSYVVHPDGRISADPAWARRHIRTGRVPILGSVTCHRLMFSQLRRALREIERAGLARLIDRPQYGGCYVARTILWDPSNPPSMHAWGLAIDLNVSTNRYGATPTMDPRVVAAFEKWGFRWGGRWKTPDGMHFELGALLRR